jgi:addiction module antidote-like protein
MAAGDSPISHCQYWEGDMVKLSKFDAAKYLDDPGTIAAYLTEALATDDPEFIRLAVDTVARAGRRLWKENTAASDRRSS